MQSVQILLKITHLSSIKSYLVIIFTNSYTKLTKISRKSDLVIICSNDQNVKSGQTFLHCDPYMKKVVVIFLPCYTCTYVCSVMVFQIVVLPNRGFDELDEILPERVEMGIRKTASSMTERDVPIILQALYMKLVLNNWHASLSQFIEGL